MKFLTQHVLKVVLLGMLIFISSPSMAQNKKMTRVATNDCGVPGAQPFLVSGNDNCKQKI